MIGLPKQLLGCTVTGLGYTYRATHAVAGLHSYWATKLLGYTAMGRGIYRAYTVTWLHSHMQGYISMGLHGYWDTGLHGCGAKPLLGYTSTGLHTHLNTCWSL